MSCQARQPKAVLPSEHCVSVSTNRHINQCGQGLPSAVEKDEDKESRGAATGGRTSRLEIGDVGCALHSNFIDV